MAKALNIASLLNSSGLLDSDDIAASAISSGKLNSNITITNDLTVGGLATVGLVSLADSNTVTYDLSQGNIARWNRGSSPVDATNTLTITGTSGGALDGMGFSIMAYNGDANSDRSITFAGGAGITIHYGDSSTITWSGPTKHTIISGLVFDSATLVINNIATVGSV